MTKILTAVKVTPMGEADPKFGQSYWGSVHEQEMPVKFNLMQPKNIGEGAKIQAEEYSVRTSSKGTEYMQLRKVKVEGGSQVQLPDAAPPPHDMMRLLELIYEDTQALRKAAESLDTVADAEDIFDA